MALKTLGQKLRASFYRGLFLQRGASSYWCRLGGVWGRVQVGGRGWLSLENDGKGKGVGRVGAGVGTGKGTGKSMRTCLSKLPFSKLPFSFSLKNSFCTPASPDH